jgi:hypothetical protein
MMSGEHFSNFFYDNLPQIVIGLGEGHVGPREKWLKVPEVLVPGEPGLASHLLAETIAAGDETSKGARYGRPSRDPKSLGDVRSLRQTAITAVCISGTPREKPLAGVRGRVRWPRDVRTRSDCLLRPRHVTSPQWHRQW